MWKQCLASLYILGLKWLIGHRSDHTSIRCVIGNGFAVSFSLLIKFLVEAPMS